MLHYTYTALQYIKSAIFELELGKVLWVVCSVVDRGTGYVSGYQSVCML
jgi:hypothetical protein